MTTVVGNLFPHPESDKAEVVERMAKATLDACREYDESWNGRFRKHTKELLDCCKEACKENGLDERVGGLIYLAVLGSWNETNTWAKEVSE
jgi:hypothetical protein